MNEVGYFSAVERVVYLSSRHNDVTVISGAITFRLSAHVYTHTLKNTRLIDQVLFL